MVRTTLAAGSLLIFTRPAGVIGLLTGKPTSKSNVSDGFFQWKE